MKHPNYEQIKRYIDDHDNYTVIVCDQGEWRAGKPKNLLSYHGEVKTVANQHLSLAIDYYNGKCPNGVEYLSAGHGWVSSRQAPHFYRDIEYRKAERKFEEGHWYPVIDRDGDELVLVFMDGCFFHFLCGIPCFVPNQFKRIGKSLGCNLHGKGG